MDPASLIGIVLVLVGIFLGSMMKGVSPVAFFGVPAAFLIVLAATLGAAMISFSTQDVKNLPKVMKKAFMPGKPPEVGAARRRSATSTMCSSARACRWPSTALTRTRSARRSRPTWAP
jgi:flagellar motor component MotA